MTHHQKWRYFSPLGLATIGLGASLLGHSIELKTTGAPLATWFWWGTLSLIVLNSGVALFGEAVKARGIFEMSQNPAKPKRGN
jgi:hypothetical protein